MAIDAATLDVMVGVSSGADWTSQASTTITVTPAVSYIAYFGDLSKYDIGEEGITLTKGINDITWSVEGEVVGVISAPVWDDFSVSMTDKDGTSQLLFYGPLTGYVHSYSGEMNTTRFRGFGYEYYLTKDKVRWMHIGPKDYIGDGTLPPSNPIAKYAATVYRWPAVSTTTAPSEIVVRLLQEGWPRWTSGSDEIWRTCSPGIAPYNILPSTTYGTSSTPFRIWKGMEEDYSATLADMIQQICEECNFIFEVVPAKLGTGEIVPRAYFIPWGSVDAELDLPSAVTITKGSTDNQLLGSFEVEENADDRYNHIHVRGYGWNEPGSSLWIAGNYYADDYDEDNERMYDVQNVFMDSSASCDSLAAYLGRSLCHSIKTYRFKLWRRFDLRLYQKIKFVGWDTTIIPADWLRIVNISYCRRLSGDYVECEAITDTDFINAPLKNAALTNEVSEMAQIMMNLMQKNIIPSHLGTVQANNGDGTVDILLQDGRKIRCNNPWE